MRESSETSICSRIARIRLETAGPRGKALFAKQLGISASTYDYYEASRVPPAGVLVKIADLASVDLRWLITGEEPSGSSPAPSNPVLRRAAAMLEAKGDSAAALVAFLDILEAAAKFPPKQPAQANSNVAAASEASNADILSAHILNASAAETDAALAGGTPATLKKAAAQNTADETVPRDGEEQEKFSSRGWIPILGRSAAGIPQFWSTRDDEQGTTALADLIDRHKKRSLRAVAPAAIDGAEPCDVQIITLREPDDADVVQYVNAPAVKRRHADAFALMVDGESMSPDIRHGDIVVLSPTAQAADGKAAVVQLERQIGVTCKLYRRVREGGSDVVHLVPVNEQFAPQTLPADTVVWALRVLARVRPGK